MLQIFGLFSGLLSLVQYIPYFRDIFRGKTKPQRASWFIWAVLGGIAFFSQLAKGATDSLWLPGVQTVGVILVALVSIKYGMGGFTRRDIYALVVAAIGLILWYFTREPAVALFIVIIVDAAGGLLTILKSYEEPETETMIKWFLSGTSGIFAAFAVGSWDWILLSYPIYIALINYAVVGAIMFGRFKQASMSQ